jgi:hypothetical protein
MPDAAPASLFKAIALDFPPAQRIGAQVDFHHSPHQKLYGLDVYFVGTDPAQDIVDRVLRECAVLAAAHRGDQDIFVHAYGLPDAGADRGQRRTLSPYGRDFFLCFDAGLCQVGVRRVGGRRFAPRHEVTPVDRIGTGEPVVDSVHPVDDDAGQAVDGASDRDRLDRAFASLNGQGICALQCAGDTMSDGYSAVADVINADGVPADRYSGFCFFHSQDLDRAREGEGLMLAFGHIDSQDAQDFIAVGRKVCEVLEQHGLRTEWNGSDKSRIQLPGMRWQRRPRR